MAKTKKRPSVDTMDDDYAFERMSKKDIIRNKKQRGRKRMKNALRTLDIDELMELEDEDLI